MSWSCRKKCSNCSLVLLYPRKLDATARDPIVERYIRMGKVPDMHDPRTDDCFTKVPPYNQGTCNDGYANAWAAMMGIRQCMYAKTHRRLSEEPPYSGSEDNASAAERDLMV